MAQHNHAANEKRSIHGGERRKVLLRRIITCLAFCGGARHELVRIVLRCVPVIAIDALVARVIVFIKLSCDAREAHGGRRVGEAGGPAAVREMRSPPLKKQRDDKQQRGRRTTSASQQAKETDVVF